VPAPAPPDDAAACPAPGLQTCVVTVAWDRRRALAVLAGLCAASVPVATWAADQENRFLRIGTGNVNGTYYQIGGLLADIVSNPPGSRPCDRGGSCGVPGLIAIAQSSSGSVANVEAIENGEVETGLAQSDVAFYAATATGPFAGRPRATHLQVLANLYFEHVHLVVRADAGIGDVTSLRGKRVSLDAEGSGTLVDARLVLAAFGVAESELDLSYTPLGPSVDRMKAGELDAFFLVAGWPAPAVSELAHDLGIRLVPITGPQVEAVLAAHGFFTSDVIPAGAYPGTAATPTIAVGAQWFVSRELPDELVYALATALWHPRARERLDAGHPRGRSIRLETALTGIALPLHPGAERYYGERGLRL
jgi:TRAP transporter TAXI family solute receptor